MSQDTEKRGRGILTKTDREFLRGEKEYANPETASHRRRDIRERVKNSIRDFELLAEELSEEDRKKIFSELNSRDDLDYVVTFLFLGLESDTIQEIEPGDYLTIPNVHHFESVIQFGTWKALRQLHFVPVSISSEVSPKGYFEDALEYLKKLIHDGEGDVGPQEVRALAAAGEIDLEKLTEFVKTELEPPFDLSGLEETEE